MECTGRLTGLSRDFESGKYMLMVEVNEASAIEQEYEKLKDLERLNLSFAKWHKKRSLDANSYFHVLVGKIANTMTLSKARAKNILICKYGQPELLPDGSEMVYKTNAPVEYMLEQEYVHCRHISTKEENGAEVNFYKVYRGSHTYNTEEMSWLIDGTVLDAKELNIETISPEELRIMKERWHI